MGRSAKFSVTEWREISTWQTESWAKAGRTSTPRVKWERKVIDGGRTKMAYLSKDVYFQVKFPIKSMSTLKIELTQLSLIN